MIGTSCNSRISAFSLSMVLALGTAALHSQTVGQDLRGAGHDSAAATTIAARDTKTATVKAYDKTRHGTRTAAANTKVGTTEAYDKTKSATMTGATDTKNGLKTAGTKTADGTKNVAHKLNPQ